MVLDPAMLGVLYRGRASILVDPYSGMDTNDVRLRVEMEALLHVRDVIAGAYVIEAAE